MTVFEKALGCYDSMALPYTSAFLLTQYFKQVHSWRHHTANHALLLVAKALCCAWGGLFVAAIPASAMIELPTARRDDLRGAIAQMNPEQTFPLEDFEFWSAQCLLLSQGDDPQKTLESCEQAILLEPNDDNLDLWASRSRALYDLGSYPEAIASFQQVLNNSPADSFALAYQCAAYRALSRHSEAVDTCEAALRENGNWGDRSPGFAWYHRGLALQQMGRLETALSSLQRATENQPENPEYLASLCALSADLGDYSLCNLRQAIVAYEQAIALQPGNATLWLHQGIALMQQESYEQALASFSRALALTPNHSLTLAHQCAVLNQLEDYEAALAACEAAFAGDQAWGRVGPAYGWVQQSSAQIGLGDYEAALASVDRALVLPLPQTDPLTVYPPAYNNRAVSLWHLGNLEAALSASDIAIALYQGNRDRFNERFVRDYPESPLDYYRGLITTHYNRGRILMSMGVYGEAIAAYDQALLLYQSCQTPPPTAAVESLCLPQLQTMAVLNHEDLAAILTNQAIAYMEAGQLGNATRAAQQATSLAAQSFPAWYNQGLILMRVGRYQEALRAYTQAGQLVPDNVYVLTGQGISLSRLGCTQTALTLLEHVLNLAPGYPLAEQERLTLLERAHSDSVGASSTSDVCTVL